MLYSFFTSLGQFPGYRLFSYISFRAIIAGIIAADQCVVWQLVYQLHEAS